MKISIRYIALCLILVGMEEVYAQTFSYEALVKPQEVKIDSEHSYKKEYNTNESSLSAEDETLERIAQSIANKNTDTIDSMTQISKALSSSQQDISATEDNNSFDKLNEEDIFIPEGELYRLDTPTFDGSTRGGQAFVEVDEKGRMKKTTKIFLFYDKFKILNTNTKVPTCNVRFNILSTLDRKITQLDIKLVWPGLTTTLSFSNVLPNMQTYYDYALLSSGCYNMDKAPNIIVNRCRIKGMTASECADKLLWLSK